MTSDTLVEEAGARAARDGVLYAGGFMGALEAPYTSQFSLQYKLFASVLALVGHDSVPLRLASRVPVGLLFRGCIIDGLIGHTGFVGSNLDRGHSFDARFNSRDIDEIRGRRFDLLVCAGVSATKWLANREPAADRAAIDRLTSALETVEAPRFVLISTVDVYPEPLGVDEHSPIAAGGAPYGVHRFGVEQFVRERFASALIVRLPGLFGPGLKKNVLFDLMHDNQVDRIDPDARFQFFDVRDTWRVVRTGWDHDLSLINAATEPIETGEIARRCFGITLPPRPGPHAHYDVHTRHAGL